MLQSKFTDNNTTDFDIPKPTSIKCSISEKEVKMALHSTKKFSAGIDKIPMIFYQKIIPPIASHIAYIFSRTLEQGFIPHRWKYVKIVPILKKHKNPMQPNSYRPLCISDCLLRIFEKILLKYLYHCAKNNISDNQHYAMKHRSTMSNMIQFTDTIYRNWENQLSTHVLFLDISAAFDSLDIFKLYKKMTYEYDFEYFFIYWIIYYLKSRIYQMLISNEDTIQFLPTCGIPQGSALSAFLFICYVNQVFTISIQSTILAYADDFKLINTNQHILMSDFTIVRHWFSQNCLLINESKTTYMIFQLRTRKNITVLPNPAIPFTPIECHKDLGIFLDCRLSYIHHISYVIRQIKRKLAFTWRYLSRITNNYVLRAWFYAIFVSFLLYGIQLYSSGSSFHLNSLDHIWQSSILKINSLCAGRRSIRSSNDLHLPTYFELLRKHDNNLISKYITGLLPSDNLFFNVPQYDSRRTEFINVPTMKLEKTQRSFWNRASRSFNEYYML